ncbi:MAG: 4-oxalocrotonate tautomerase family protein [Clostridiaceae bacterium]|nr:4-oxalocrotonate tautomerase family protein [Clostridiaceae bacterium]
MPVVDITMWKGRTVQQKSELAKSITDEMVRIFKVKEDSVQVIYHEIEKENWVIGGKIFE